VQLFTKNAGCAVILPNIFCAPGRPNTFQKNTSLKLAVSKNIYSSFLLYLYA